VFYSGFGVWVIPEAKGWVGGTFLDLVRSSSQNLGVNFFKDFSQKVQIYESLIFVNCEKKPIFFSDNFVRKWSIMIPA